MSFKEPVKGSPDMDEDGDAPVNYYDKLKVELSIEENEEKPRFASPIKYEP